MAQDDKQMNDFMEQALAGLRTWFEPGERIHGTIVSISRNAIFVDVGATSEGIIERGEFEDKEGELTVAVGDTVDAYFLGMDRGELRLTVRGQSANADDHELREAYAAEIPVQGTVTAERKGGFTVKVGAVEGFCPFSQIDRRGAAGEAAAYLGGTFSFLIVEYEDFGGPVLSRRALQDREAAAARERLQEELHEGDIVEGVVAKIMPFGVFVDIGGADGLVPMSEVAWGHVEDAAEVVQPGDSVQVVVLSIDWTRDRIGLSLRRAGRDPWDEVEDKYPVGGVVEGRVTRLMPFGAFVELEPGVEGLLHISRLGGRRLNHPGEVLREGQQLELRIDKVDREQERISLDLPANAPTPRAGGQAESAAGQTAEVRPGAELAGVVEGIQPYGVFVKLDDEHTGLLHISEIADLDERGNAFGQLEKRFAVGSALRVVVKEQQGKRIALTLPGSEEEQEYREYLDNERGGDLGTLGDLFGDLKL